MRASRASRGNALRAQAGQTPTIDAENTRNHCIKVELNCVTVDGFTLRNAVDGAETYGITV